jgi:glycosyltransferase involved in cell wall biosynthesis
MKVSLCTTVMNRFHHIKETLPKNLTDNTYSNLEFVILNYNSNGNELDRWITNFSKDMESGKLAYYKEISAPSFKPSHSRNVCALMATGDIICNIDADNYTGKEFANHLADTFIEKFNTVCCSKYIEVHNSHTSTYGRLALPKKNFLSLGGYNEDFVYGWGGEDDDLLRRCKASGLTIHHITDEYLQYIQHSDEERIQNIDFTNLPDKEGDVRVKSRDLHTQISIKNVTSGKLIANRGRKWGSALLTKNFKHLIKSGYGRALFI